MKRINPLTKKEEAGISETARLELEEHGKCPLCGEENLPGPMPIIEVGDTLGYVCERHCVCLPVEDINPIWAQRGY